MQRIHHSARHAVAIGLNVIACAAERFGWRKSRVAGRIRDALLRNICL
jgi:hypothetical protein